MGKQFSENSPTEKILKRKFIAIYTHKYKKASKGVLAKLLPVTISVNKLFLICLLESFLRIYSQLYSRRV